MKIKAILDKITEFGFNPIIDAAGILRFEKHVLYLNGYMYRVVLEIHTVDSVLPYEQRDFKSAKFYGPGTARLKGTSPLNIVYGSWKTVDGTVKALNKLSKTNFIK